MRLASPVMWPRPKIKFGFGSTVMCTNACICTKFIRYGRYESIYIPTVVLMNLLNFWMYSAHDTRAGSLIAARWLRFGHLQRRCNTVVNVRVAALVLAPHRPSRSRLAARLIPPCSPHATPRGVWTAARRLARARGPASQRSGP